MEQPQKVEVVSCVVTPKEGVGATEFDVTVRVGNGQAFRLRSHNGRPLKQRNFTRSNDPLKAVEWLARLFEVGSELEMTLDVIGARWQTAADGFVKGDRAVDPIVIRSLNPAMYRNAASSPRPPNQAPIECNNGVPLRA